MERIQRYRVAHACRCQSPVIQWTPTGIPEDAPKSARLGPPHPPNSMTHRLPHAEAPVIREDAPPPGVEIYTGQSTEGAFIVKLITVEGEADGELLAALIAYTERIDRKRLGVRPRLTLVAS